MAALQQELQLDCERLQQRDAQLARLESCKDLEMAALQEQLARLQQELRLESERLQQALQHELQQRDAHGAAVESKDLEMAALQEQLARLESSKTSDIESKNLEMAALRAAQETQLALLESCASRESESKDLEIAALHAEMEERTPRKAAAARLESLRFSLKELEIEKNNALMELDDTRNRLQHFQGARATSLRVYEAFSY